MRRDRTRLRRTSVKVEADERLVWDGGAKRGGRRVTYLQQQQQQQQSQCSIQVSGVTSFSLDFPNPASYDISDDGDLSAVSLYFRLMRQHGYHVPSDVFNKFKDEDGKFKSELSSDIEGILGLYEAAYLGVPGENILDEAIEFAKTCLLNYSGERVSPALKRPLRKGVEKQEQLFFISITPCMSKIEAMIPIFSGWPSCVSTLSRIYTRMSSSLLPSN
ncbi:unnamed protein product [Linum tenue]|uniref:Terpene synthase N-terminal domain-containing protein n=1 Tax=Linum tenue TaxID=586396 RepID=A0AAV0NQE7_9ROSI|nr:unnamed protein product [Linum tenue]